MRRYETIVILDPDLDEPGRETIFQKVTDLISEMDGFLVELDQWGNRKLAYNIMKKARGFYLRFDYCGEGTLVSEIERNLQIDDGALKYMTVQLEAVVDLEALKAELTAAKEEKAKQEAAEAEKRAQAEAAQAEAAAKAAEVEKSKPEVEATGAAQEDKKDVAADESADAPEAENKKAEPAETEEKTEA
jgi:small subunit ribosomal protein S6